MICPQGGGKITDDKPSDTFTTCIYCETKFAIEREKPKPPPLITPEYEYEPSKSSMSSQQILVTVFVCAAIIIGEIIFIAVVANKNEKPDYTYGGYSKPTPATKYTPPISPTPIPNQNLLEFGGKGTGEGLFQDADFVFQFSQGNTARRLFLRKCKK